MSAKKHKDIVTKLIDVLNEHEGWDMLLASSIKDACVKAHNMLNDEQKLRFDTLPNEKNFAWQGEKKSKNYINWPNEDTPVDETLETYYQFLDAYVEWIPTESGHDEHVDEILFQLGRFYWLLDQPTGLELQQNVQEQEAKGNDFTQWMVDFANAWGSFLNTSASLTKESLLSFYDAPTFNLTEYIGSVEEPEKGKTLDETRWDVAQVTWKSFNQLFSRTVKPGLRPVAGMFDDGIICAPADFVPRMKAKIDSDSKIIVKHTHSYSVIDLLDGSPYRDRFKGGLFMHGFLSTFDYHRFMSPVRGTVLESRAIQAEVYLGVVINPETLSLDVTDETGYQFSQTRGLIIWDSPIGLVAALPMGMAQVSSVNMTAMEGVYLNKGDEFGYFMFGGSDMILLFEAGSDVTINAAPTIHLNAGMCIGEAIPAIV